MFVIACVPSAGWFAGLLVAGLLVCWFAGLCDRPPVYPVLADALCLTGCRLLAPQPTRPRLPSWCLLVPYRLCLLAPADHVDHQADDVTAIAAISRARHKPLVVVLQGGLRLERRRQLQSACVVAGRRRGLSGA